MAIDRYGGRNGVTSEDYQVRPGSVGRSVILIDPKGIVRAFDYFQNQKVEWEKFQTIITFSKE